jgi:hypothetical protein
LRRLMGLGVLAQVVVGMIAHASDKMLTLSGVLGTAISFVLGLWYGTMTPDAMKDAATGGFLIGIVSTAVATMAAIFFGDQTWMSFTFAPVASGITGLLGGVVGTGHRAETDPAASVETHPPEGADAP